MLQRKMFFYSHGFALTSGMKNFFTTGLFFLYPLYFLLAQSPDILKIRQFRAQNENAIINEFVSFLSIPNVADDSINIKNNAAFLMDMMKKRGIQNVQLL